MATDDLSQYTEDEIIEKCKSNPFFFARNFCKIKHPSQGIIHFDLYDFQKDLVKNIFSPDKKFFSIVKSRQLGISTVSALMALWLCTFRNGVEISIVSANQKVAKKLLSKVKLMYSSVPKFLRQKTRYKNKTVMEFENESRIESLAFNANTSTRSIASTWVIIDEAHYLPDGYKLWKGIEPSVDHGEKVIALSSPNGPFGWFFDINKQAEENDDSEWEQIKLPWYVHPDRQLEDGSPNWEWRKKKDLSMGKREARQEYDAVFGMPSDSYYDPDFIELQEENFQKDPIEKDGNLWIWEKPQKGEKYIISVDCAEGGGDNNVIEVFKVSTMEQVAEYVSDIDYEIFGYEPVRVGKMYNYGHLIIEQNSVGTAVTQRARDLGYPNLYFRGANNDQMALNISKPKVGWKTTSRTRPLVIEALRSLFETEDGLTIRSKRLLNELKTFIVKNGKPQAKNGYNDDIVMATAIGCFVYNTFKFNDEQYGDREDMVGLMAIANGKAKEKYKEVEQKSQEDLIKEKEIKEKKKFAKHMTGGYDQEIKEHFNWL